MSKIVILGAGLAGISAAYHLKKLGIKYELYEKDSRIGGLCKSEKAAGFIFDYTGHLIHLRSKYGKRLVQNLLQENLKEQRRNSWIFSNGVYTKYPFQCHLYGLPPKIINECLTGFKERKDKPDNNFEDWIYTNFGKGIAKYFMLPYNTKQWTVPPRELTTEWLNRFVPRVSLDELIEGATVNSKKQFGYNATFRYPKTGGIEELIKSFAIRNAQLKYAATKISSKKKILKFKNRTKIKYQKLISTIPMPELIKIIDAPARVKEATRKLKYCSVFNVNLGINRKKITDMHWIYIPGPKYVFYRVGFPMNFSASLTPPEKSSMYTEVSYSKNKPIDKKNMVKKIINDLQKIGLLRQDDRILVTKIFDIKYAYVIYDKNYQNSTKIIKEFLDKNNIYTIGRFGAWQYSSMEDSILEGEKIAKELQ